MQTGRQNRTSSCIRLVGLSSLGSYSAHLCVLCVLHCFKLQTGKICMRKDRAKSTLVLPAGAYVAAGKSPCAQRPLRRVTVTLCSSYG